MLDAGPWQAIRNAEKLTSIQLAQAASTLGFAQRLEGSDNASLRVETSQGSSLKFAVYKTAELQKRVRDEIMHLCRTNMRAMYEATPGGWNESEKRGELFDRTSRFVLVTAQNDGELLAFVNWRFDVEECDENDPCSRGKGRAQEADYGDLVEVAYCYELQVSSTFQGHGVGRMLMQMLEAVAKTVSMRKVMLTVFQNNKQALTFYRRNDYVIDGISPSQVQGVESIEGNSMGDYEIMSKSLYGIS